MPIKSKRRTVGDVPYLRVMPEVGADPHLTIDVDRDLGVSSAPHPQNRNLPDRLGGLQSQGLHSPGSEELYSSGDGRSTQQTDDDRAAHRSRVCRPPRHVQGMRGGLGTVAPARERSTFPVTPALSGRGLVAAPAPGDAPRQEARRPRRRRASLASRGRGRTGLFSRTGRETGQAVESHEARAPKPEPLTYMI
jgi:hypothetical protein